MMEVLFLEEAEIELSEAVAYYENICQGLGLDFSNEVKTLIIRLIEMPFFWVLRDDGKMCFNKEISLSDSFIVLSMMLFGL